MPSRGPARQADVAWPAPDLATGVNEAVKLGATEVSNSYGGTEEAGEEAAYQTVQRDGWRLQHPVRRSLVAAGHAGLDEHCLRVQTPRQRHLGGRRPVHRL
jgi:hypothetical protein